MDDELNLMLGEENWQNYTRRNFDENFSNFRQRILDRDDYTCQLCGFQASSFMDIFNLDGDYRNNAQDNLVVSCPFCIQCHFLEMVGKTDFGGGSLIYLPEMTQIELNGLVHILFIAIANTTDFSVEAQNIFNSLRLRSKSLEKAYGDGMSNPHIMGQMLIDTPMSNREDVKNQMLNGVRLLPSLTKFERQVEAWAKAALANMGNN